MPVLLKKRAREKSSNVSESKFLADRMRSKKKKKNSRTRKLFERINLRGKRTDSNMFGSSTNLRKINLFYVLLAGSGCRKVDDSCRDKNRLEHTFP